MLLPLLQNNLLDDGTAFAVLSGTALSGLTEQQVKDGGETIIITLSNDTWVAAGAAFDTQRQNIIDGITSAQSETLGWNNVVRDNEVVTSVVRTSDTVVTITLSAAPTYDVTADETITATIPASALVTSATPIVAIPTIGVTADAEVVDEEIFSGGWGFLNSYDSYRQKKERDKRRLKRLLEEIKALESPIDREIAEILHKDTAEDTRLEQLAELERMVASSFRNSELEKARTYSERVAKAYVRANVQGNFSALEALEREIERAREEEEFLLIAIAALA